MVSDIIRKLNKKLDVSIKPVPGLNWAQMLDKFDRKEVDLVASIARTPERMEKYLFTNYYLNLPLVLISREEFRFVVGLGDLKNERVAVVKGYITQKYLARDYPNLQIVECKDMHEALTAVSQGRADALVDVLAVAEYAKRQLGIANLRVAATTAYDYEICFAVRKDWPELVPILNKGLADLSESEKSLMLEKWMGFRVERQLDWALLGKWIIGISLLSAGIIFFFLYNNRKLSREVVERKKAEKAAQAANKAKSEFIANMSHEIRTPMNAVLGFTEILKSKVSEPELTHYIDTIHTSGKALLSLINDILDLSKVEAGKLTLRYSAVSIEQLFAEMRTVFEKRMTEYGLDCQVHIQDGMPPMLLLDETRVRQILINLIGNAVKFTESGYIRLSAQVLKNGATNRSLVNLKLTVEDTGIGIQEDQCEKIFQAFEQSDGLKTSTYGGTGLGLAITRRLIEVMNGRITVESQVGKGTTFHIDLYDIEVAASETIEDKKKTHTPETVRFDPAVILVADDIDYNRELIANLLINWDFKILAAADGLEAVEKARKYRPDLVLLDMKMPVMDGYEAAKRIRNLEFGLRTGKKLPEKDQSKIQIPNSKIQKIPIIAVTASALKQDVEKISRLCDGYMAKPIRMDELLKELMRFLPHSVETPAGPEIETDYTVETPSSEEELSQIPPELIKDLSDAIRLGYPGTIKEYIHKIRHYAPRLAERLNNLAKDFEYERIQKVLDKM